MDFEQTDILLEENEEESVRGCDSPLLFVCQGKSITEFSLSGTQVMGRPADGARPDIPVFNRFVSRRHAVFETEGDCVWYTALDTTNPTKFRGKALSADEKFQLADGDELVISSETIENSETVILIFASSISRIRLWRELQQASRDKLTGLCNREEFSGWWFDNCASRDYEQACLFMLDVDDFKQINDLKGHNSGDRVLRIVADELKKMVRYEQQICRWGGDEFVGVLSGEREHVQSRLISTAQRITEAYWGSDVRVTVSIGCVEVSGVKDRADMDILVEKADQALYRVKNSGKNGIAFFI